MVELEQAVPALVLLRAARMPQAGVAIRVWLGIADVLA